MNKELPRQKRLIDLNFGNYLNGVGLLDWINDADPIIITSKS